MVDAICKLHFSFSQMIMDHQEANPSLDTDSGLYFIRFYLGQRHISTQLDNTFRTILHKQNIHHNPAYHSHLTAIHLNRTSILHSPRSTPSYTLTPFYPNPSTTKSTKQITVILSPSPSPLALLLPLTLHLLSQNQVVIVALPTLEEVEAFERKVLDSARQIGLGRGEGGGTAAGAGRGRVVQGLRVMVYDAADVSIISSTHLHCPRLGAEMLLYTRSHPPSRHFIVHSTPPLRPAIPPQPIRHLTHNLGENYQTPLPPSRHNYRRSEP